MDYLEAINDKDNDIKQLKDRMDDDLELFNLTDHEMKKFDGKTAMPRMRNVTLPAPQSFGKRVLAVLHKSTRQTVVKGDDLSQEKEHNIEQFVDIGFEVADDLLANKQMLPLKAFQNSIAALRGGTASRNLVYQNQKGEVVFDILPWDLRDVTWESGKDGLIWAAYKRKLSGTQIEQEFGLKKSGRDIEVTDVWDRQGNYVFVGKKEVAPRVGDNGHGLDYVPVVIQPVSLVPMLTLRNSNVETPLKYYFESIFSGSRKLYSKLNDLATLFQSMAVEAYHPAMQKETEELDADIDVPGAGDVIPVTPNQLYREMPKREMYQVQLHAWNVLISELQRATLPFIEFGELAFELSAVAIAKLGEGRELVFAPIIICHTRGYKATARMMIDQFIKGNFETKIGLPGRKINYSPDKLKGDYDIRFDFHSISPEENIANYAVGQAAKALNILPNDVILEEILKRSNPADDKKKMADQKLEEMDPKFYFYRQARRLIEEKRYIEAKMIASNIGMTLEQVEGKQTKAAAKKVQGMPSLGAKTPSAEQILITEMDRKGLRPQEQNVAAS